MKKCIGNFFFFSLCLVLSGMTSCVKAQSCSDDKATSETRALYENLYSLSKNFTLFGHQDDMAYGVNWKYQEGRSDIKSVIGEYPAVFGWDIGHLELGKKENLDGVPFDKMKGFIREAYRRGTVVTISWHLNNPLTGGSAWDTTHLTVKSLLEGGSRHILFKGWLDRVADFLKDLKGAHGEYIPVLLRPFHEYTGNWFWWCQNACTPQEFKALWKFTIDYLREEKGLHQLLMVLNTAHIESRQQFDLRYPGDDVVDVISMDTYQQGKTTNTEFIQSARKQLQLLQVISEEKKKILALAETGFESVPDKKWWSEVLLPVLRGIPVAWVLVWRNHGYQESTGKMHYYAPYPGQVSADDFKFFSSTPSIFFENKIRERNIYRLSK